MQTLQFDTHIDGFYSLAAIRVGYPLLKIGKMADLKCHLICAIDKAVNLHFIQYREQLPTDPMIYPPSHALTGHPSILFSVELLSIIKEAHHKHLNEKDFVHFAEQLESMQHCYSDVYVLKPGVFLLKPFKPSPVYLIDLTARNLKAKIIHEFRLVNCLRGWDDDMVVFSSESLKGILAHSFGLQKTKKLRFSDTQQLIDLRTVFERNLCVALFKNMIEILDLRRNCIIERSVFEFTSQNMIAASPEGSRVAHYYISKKARREEIFLDIWDIDGNTKIRKRDPILLNNLIVNENCLEFLSEELLLCIDRWHENLCIYRVEKYGMTRVYTIKPDDTKHLKPIANSRRYEKSHIDLEVLSMSNFLVMTTDSREGGYSRIQSYNINPTQAISHGFPNSSYQKLTMLNGSASNLSVNGSSATKSKAKLDTRASLLFEERAEAVIAICLCKAEKIGILDNSYRFQEYDLRSGKLEKRFVLAGIASMGAEIKIKYFDEDHLIVYSELSVVVINLTKSSYQFKGY